MEAFVSLIESWLRFPLPKRAELLLDKMEELYTPSGRIYERVINAYSFLTTECGNRINFIGDDMPGDEGPELEEKKVKEMKLLREEAVFYSDRALDLLSRMEQLCEEIGGEFRPALSTYTSVVNSIVRSSDKDSATFAGRREMVGQVRERRDRIYNSLEMKKLQITSVEEVFATIKYLENADDMLQKLKLDDKSLPIGNRFNFNLVINALAQAGETWAAHAAEDILDYMIRNHSVQVKLTPNIQTVNFCINAWAHCSSETDSPSRAEAILENLNTLQTSAGILTNLVPDSVSYNSIIKAYANAGNAQRAEAILETMVQLYESTGDVKIKPDLISYSSVLNAYAKAAARDPSSSKKSEEILLKMMKRQGGTDEQIVNTWCFNTVSLRMHYYYIFSVPIRFISDKGE